MKKIKDLHPDTNLGGIKVKTSDGKIGYWHSQWNNGVWLKPDLNKNNMEPVFVTSLLECLEWEIIEEKTNEHL